MQGISIMLLSINSWAENRWTDKQWFTHGIFLSLVPLQQPLVIFCNRIMSFWTCAGILHFYNFVNTWIVVILHICLYRSKPGYIQFNNIVTAKQTTKVVIHLYYRTQFFIYPSLLHTKKLNDYPICVPERIFRFTFWQTATVITVN